MFICALFAVPALAGTLPARGTPAANPSRANAVKDVFRTSWSGYYQHAFPHDTLRPTSGGFEDDRNEWGATAIDALSTAIIMGETDTVADILKFVPTINYTTTQKPDDSISLFETNIRYLAGMLSSYDLLKGPLKSVAPDSKSVDALLKQAQSLADSLSFAFDTESGVPQNTLFLNPAPKQGPDTTNSLAGSGTLVLEWTRLSDLTGNATYAKLAQKGQSHLINPNTEAFPGLVGSTIDLKSGAFTDQNGGWTAGSDSFYEYLIKMYLYDPSQFSDYKDRWVLAADSTMQHLASHPSKAKDLTFLCDYSGTQTHTESQHLASFAGGNFILGGILLNEDKYIQFGLQLAESYWETYNRTASGIGPEVFAWNGNPPADQAAFYNTSGFYATAKDYVLRPETMESLYYAYRVTGDTKWQDMAWESFQRIRSLCRTGAAYGGLNDVTQANGGGTQDDMESFWLAETLKYMYLIFADSPVHVQKSGNEFVFNTEAHPMSVRKPTSS